MYTLYMSSQSTLIHTHIVYIQIPSLINSLSQSLSQTLIHLATQNRCVAVLIYHTKPFPPRLNIYIPHYCIQYYTILHMSTYTHSTKWHQT